MKKKFEVYDDPDKFGMYHVLHMTPDRGSKLMDDENMRILRRSPELLDALRRLMNYTGGWDCPPSHPCGKAAQLLRAIDEGRD